MITEPRTSRPTPPLDPRTSGRAATTPAHRATSLRSFARNTGPGIIAGAADDDPSGIATYSIAGAQFGTALLWTSLITWPLMAAVQAMCARIGMVTGGGLASALRTRVPRWLMVTAAAALFITNTFNIGADLVGMADAAQLLSGIDSHWWVAGFGVALATATVEFRYRTIARALQWLALVLIAYVIAAISLGPSWGDVARATLLPEVPRDHAGWATLVAILGTTISPYLFFWQSSQEMEEERAMGRTTLTARRGATRGELMARRVDVVVGTFFSNVVMFFIILTTALTLHPRGMIVETSSQAAEALRPIAGDFAALLYTVGLIGTGALAIPVLAGSAAYALAETFGWREGIDRRFAGARRFYLVIVASIAAGGVLEFSGFGAVKAMYASAVLNGLLAPVLLVGILLVASNRTLMRGQPSSWPSRIVVGLTALAMTACAIAMVLA